jgi:serine/threonine protein kinase
MNLAEPPRIGRGTAIALTRDMQSSSSVLAPASGEAVRTAAEETFAAECARDPRLSLLPAHLTPLRVLGQGGSSIVYEALHTRLKVRVALKLLTIGGQHAEEAHKRMRREAELYALLDDPRIPRVYDVNELPDGTPYVVMEMVPGESLEELLLRQGALRPEHALRIAREILIVLASVHERGVLHRDVKPANVILKLGKGGPEEVRLVDFGIAKMSTHGTGEEAVTQRGALVGTPHYMAPERLAGYPANASTDIYAVGIMLYEMLSGAVPFTGQSLAAIMAAVMRQVPAPLAQQGVEVTPALSRVVMKAMARAPEDRFASAREMLSELDALTEPTGPDPVVFPPKRPSARRRGRFWFLAALLCALLVSVGFLLAGERVPLRAESAGESALPERVPAHEPRAAGAFDLPIPLLPASLARDVPRASSLHVAPAEARGSAREPTSDEALEQVPTREKKRHRSDEARRRSSAQKRQLGSELDQVEILPANPY